MGSGRRKRDIKKIENPVARSTCFTKRRKGLFKKVDEFARKFPDTKIAAIVISAAGNHFTFGDPSNFFERVMGNGVSELGSAGLEAGESRLLFDELENGCLNLSEFTEQQNLGKGMEETLEKIDSQLQKEIDNEILPMPDEQVDAMVQELLFSARS